MNAAGGQGATGQAVTGQGATTTPSANPNAAAAASAAAANRNPAAAAGAADNYAGVRGSYNNANLYGAQWHTDHPSAWAATGWAAGQAWAPSSWAGVSTHLGYVNATPISYNYGVNVVSQGGNVLVDGQNVGTNEEFSQQAADLAATGAAPPTDAAAPSDAAPSDTAAPGDGDQWMPLGVYGMVKDDKQHAHLIVQLAVNPQGILRGNYTDELTDHTLPIQGAVDKTSQRAAWTVGTNKSTVMEAGLNDLTQSEAPALIHKNGQTDHWILVRLEQPAGDGAAPAEGDKPADPPATP